MQEQLRQAGTFLAGLAIGVGGVLGYQAVEGRLKGFLVDDPLAYVTVVEDREPAAIVPGEVLRRLDNHTRAKWRATWYTDNTVYDTPRLEDAKRELKKRVVFPPVQEYAYTSLISNLDDPASVKANGALHVLWFHDFTTTYAWLLGNPRIFTDAALEGERRTYWMGKFAVYYSPAGAERDHSAAIEPWLKEVVQCPMDSNPCQLPEDMQGS